MPYGTMTEETEIILRGEGLSPMDIQPDEDAEIVAVVGIIASGALDEEWECADVATAQACADALGLKLPEMYPDQDIQVHIHERFADGESVGMERGTLYWSWEPTPLW